METEKRGTAMDVQKGVELKTVVQQNVTESQKDKKTC